MDDPSYKRLFTHRRIVRDLLTGFIGPRRPAGWAAALDFDTLRVGPTENITDELRKRLGDVVWSIDRHGFMATAARGQSPIRPTRCCTWWSTTAIPAGTRP